MPADYTLRMVLTLQNAHLAFGLAARSSMVRISLLNPANGSA